MARRLNKASLTWWWGQTFFFCIPCEPQADGSFSHNSIARVIYIHPIWEFVLRSAWHVPKVSLWSLSVHWSHTIMVAAIGASVFFVVVVNWHFLWCRWQVEERSKLNRQSSPALQHKVANRISDPSLPPRSESFSSGGLQPARTPPMHRPIETQVVFH